MKNTENTTMPTRREAENILKEAEICNPGPWGDHSRNVAMCAEKIAVACGMDGEKAYILGLLHDIGRKFGTRHLGHVYDGYTYMLGLGYPQVAKICLTHSFSDHNIKTYIGRFDILPSEQEELEQALALSFQIVAQRVPRQLAHGKLLAYPARRLAQTMHGKARKEPIRWL